MNYEPLKTLLDLSENKKSIISMFLPDEIYQQISDLDLVNDFYLNDKVFMIKRNTLELDIIGKIINISDNKITIMKRNNQTVLYINPNNYYIFIKRTSNKNNDRIFYESLLEKM